MGLAAGPAAAAATTYVNVAPYIGRALRENSGLRVFVGQGYYDFATPFFGAEYSLSRTGIPRERIHWHYYGSGHMMYVRDEDRAKLSPRHPRLHPGAVELNRDSPYLIRGAATDPS